MNSLELMLIYFEPSGCPKDEVGLWNSADLMFNEEPAAGASEALKIPPGYWFFIFCCLLIFAELTWS